MSNPTLENMAHELWPLASRPNTIFVPGTADDNNVTEFLLEKRPCCLLSYTSTFKFVFFRELTHYASPFDALELEQLTLLSLKMSIISLHKQLWTAYLQSGTGQLEKSHLSRRQDEETQLHYWPTYLHSFTVARAFAKIIKGDPMEYERHVESVKKYLAHLDEQHHQYLTQFDALKSEMPLFTPALAYLIEELVRKHALPAVNVYFDTIITLIKHDYIDRFMQLQYVRQKPTQEQVCLPSLYYSSRILVHRLTKRIVFVN